MAAGAFVLWPVDKENNFVGVDDQGNPKPPPNPADPKSVNIYFGRRSGVTEPPPKDQNDLVDKIQRVLRTINVLYRPDDSESSAVQLSRFRNCYMRLFALGRLGLEVDNAAPDLAAAALASTIADLIDDEAGNVKGTHLRKLAKPAARLAAGCGFAYLLFQLIHANSSRADAFFLSLGFSLSLLASFMALLVGCFLGVWLSYAIRTTTFTLSDLTVTDADRLSPLIRLLFAGALTVILGILFVIPLVEVSIGHVPVTKIGDSPMMAFVVGCFCGISELALPAAVAKRASDFIQNIK